MEVARETKELPPLPTTLDANSGDEIWMKQLIPDGGMARTIEDAARQECEAAIRRKRGGKVRLVLEIMKDQENKSEELREHWEEKDAHGEDNRRNALMSSSRMNTSTVILNVTNVVKYGPDYSCCATNYGPVHDHSRHSTQNDTYTDNGQYVGTSDGKTILGVPSLDGMC